MAEPKYGYLVIISRSGGDGKAFPMHNSRVVIGRKETCDIRMQRPQVSKMHCVLRAVGKDVVLRNYGENGTSINNIALEAGKQQTLKHNDIITIVGRSLRYEQPRPATPSQQPQRLASLNGPQSEIIVRKIDKPLIRRQSFGSSALFGGKRPNIIGSPETARRFQKWNEHYKGEKLDTDDPFASSGTSSRAFQQMARSVQSFSLQSTPTIEPHPNPHTSNLDLAKRSEEGGVHISRASPLQRTRSVGFPGRCALSRQQPSDNGSDSDEVPTEPEPESDSDHQPPPKPPAPKTPSMRMMLTQTSSVRKSVRFGPQLSPELFDTHAPPSTPLRRGTPMRMARVSSILRQATPQPANALQPAGTPLPMDAIFDMEGAANDSIVSLSSLPVPTPCKQQPQQQKLIDHTPESICVVSTDSPITQQTITPSRLLCTDKHTNSHIDNCEDNQIDSCEDNQIDSCEDNHVDEPQEPIREIESPQTLGSPEDRRSRRRRSLRAVTQRVAAEEESNASSQSSPSPSLLVRTRKADQNTLTPSRLFQSSPSRLFSGSPSYDKNSRKRRRQTAPDSLWSGIGKNAIDPSLAEMARALGEDLPQIPLAVKSKGSAVETNEHIEAVKQKGEDDKRESSSSSEAEEPMPLTNGPTVGLAEAMQQQQQQQQQEEGETLQSASEQLLREQAALQARLGTVSLEDLKRPSTTTKQQLQQRRRTTSLEHLRNTHTANETADEAEAEIDVTMHRERLRRQQERRRRRQTIAALKQRRSSWRGWAGTEGALLSSPPQSPDISESHLPHSPLPTPSTAETAVESARLLSFPQSASMYPPANWNSPAASFERSQPPLSDSDRTMPRQRRLSEFEPLYPPQPRPIELDWEIVDIQQIEQPTKAEDNSQQVQLHAVQLDEKEAISDSAVNPSGSSHESVSKNTLLFSPPRTRSRSAHKPQAKSSVRLVRELQALEAPAIRDDAKVVGGHALRRPRATREKKGAEEKRPTEAKRPARGRPAKEKPTVEKAAREKPSRENPKSTLKEKRLPARSRSSSQAASSNRKRKPKLSDNLSDVSVKRGKSNNPASPPLTRSSKRT